ncbi:MAG: hypothetical protein GY939_22500 [Actinomycetia bacterium]|nr:hypothetical protein [Actinomycetes bacterium]
MAIEAMVRIDKGGAYANLILPEILERSDLSGPDRRFVTELVYGTTRMQRACDHLVDRFLLSDIEPVVRAALRIGAYQLAFLDTPPHAALDATVGAVSGRGRSVVNAVLRRVAKAPVEYPDQATKLSYPDWIIDRLSTDLGAEAAIAALEAMNRAATTTVRADGYIQDPASELVVDAVGAGPGDRVVDLCAAPGGKSTAMAAAGATVIASDRRPGRVRLTRTNATTVGAELGLVVADGTAPPFRPASVDRVLVDAPCSGLGSLRRRPDARWRIDADAPERLARLQTELTVAGFDLLRPGGVLTYSVCTLTAAESSGVLDAVLSRVTADLMVPAGEPWSTGHDQRISMLLPAETDGMVLFQLGRP